MVSVHLDFSRKSIRQRQAREIIARLAGRRRPLVLMGDFNCGYSTKDPTLGILARELNLYPHEPEATDMVSFPRRNRRFDWIMVSADFSFRDYRTLPNVLSDHRAVVATLELAPSGEGEIFAVRGAVAYTAAVENATFVVPPFGGLAADFRLKPVLRTRLISSAQSMAIPRNGDP